MARFRGCCRDSRHQGTRGKTAAGETPRTKVDAWDQHEYVIATAARIPVIEGVALSFKLGILKIAELLWRPTELKLALQRMSRTADSPTATHEPSDKEEEEDSDLGDAPNATIEQTRVLLKAIPRRIDVLLDSTGRTGAQTALQMVHQLAPTDQTSKAVHPSGGRGRDA